MFCLEKNEQEVLNLDYEKKKTPQAHADKNRRKTGNTL